MAGDGRIVHEKVQPAQRFNGAAHHGYCLIFLADVGLQENRPFREPLKFFHGFGIVIDSRNREMDSLRGQPLCNSQADAAIPARNQTLFAL